MRVVWMSVFAFRLVCSIVFVRPNHLTFDRTLASTLCFVGASAYFRIVRVRRSLSSLEHLHALEELNLADNRIASFAEIPHFARLSGRLRALYLSDPHFGDNPVCALCNYRTYAVHQV
jgi:hypothetical protein